MDDGFDPLPPTFNSSDFEISENEVQPAKKRKTGHRMAAAILANQVEDRRESKKALRTLQFSHGAAPGTRSLHDGVAASWDAYCQTIGLPVDEYPDGDRVFQYIDTVIRRSKSSLPGKPVISIDVVRAHLKRLIKLLKFRHQDIFKHYTVQHAARIEAHLQQLLSKGKLVKGTWYKKQWISFMTLLKMAKGWFQSALTEGTYSWDIALSKITSVVTQSALSSRSGDITRSQLYEGLECLCWGDITLQLDDNFDRSLTPTVGDLRGTFLLRFTKWSKGISNKDQLIHCDPLSNTSQSPACAIKLIVILALRFGYVEGSTLDEVLSRAAQRVDGTIQWKLPDAPVFSQLMRGYCPFLNLEKPAGQEQIRHSLQEIAFRSGMLEDRIDTRALRTGALRDQTYVQESIPGVATLATAMLAGHSSHSYNMGTTRDYVGPLEISSFNLRAEHSRVDRMAPKFAEDAPSKDDRRRFSKKEIDDYMKAHKMNMNNVNDRKTAGRRLKKERESEWRDKAKTQPMRQRTMSEANVGVSKGAKVQKSVSAAPSFSTKETADAEKYFSAPPPASVASSSTNIVDDDQLIDPEVREHDRAVCKAMQGLTDTVFLDGGANSDESTASEETDDVQIDAADEVDLAMQDALASENTAAATPVTAFLSPSQDVQLADIEAMSGDDFVRFFSRINIYQTNNASYDRSKPEDVRKHQPWGNSRDEPTPWLYYCEQGCGHSTFSEHYLKEHQLNCDGKPREKLVPCPRKGCNKTFKNEATMKAHVANDHDFEPKPCGLCPTEPLVLFPTRAKYDQHRQKVHVDPIEEQDCPLVAACKSERKFTSKAALKKHLKAHHHLTTKELGEYVRDSRRDRVPKVGRKNKPKGWHLEQFVDEEDSDDEGEEGA